MGRSSSWYDSGRLTAGPGSSPGRPPMNDNDTAVVIQWLAIAYRPGLLWDQPSLQRYFVPKAQPAFFRKLGIPGSYYVVPYALIPRDGFHVLTSRKIPGATFSQERRRLPYNVRLLDLNADIVSVVSRLYPMGIQSVHVTARLQLNTNAPPDELLNCLQPLRKPHTVHAADYVIRQTLALATGDRTIDTSSLTYKTYFGTQISLPVQADQMPMFIQEHRASIVALLIGNPQPQALSSQIIDRLVKANKRLNEKSGFEYLLANRQGLIYLLPRERYTSPHPERFKRSTDISELALYTSTFLEFSHDERRQHENLVDFLFSRIETWVENPQVVFPSSMTSRLQWEVLSDAFSLAAILKEWKRANENSLSRESKATLFHRVPKDWWLIPELPRFLEELEVS
jgi:hypothetical protein